MMVNRQPEIDFLEVVAGKDSCSTGAVGVVAPCPQPVGLNGARFPLLKRHLLILSLLCLQQILPKLPFGDPIVKSFPLDPTITGSLIRYWA